MTNDRRYGDNSKGQGHAPKGRGIFSFSDFDELPKPIRDFLNFAPYAAAVDDIKEGLQNGMSVEAMLASLTKGMKIKITKDTTEVWGDPERNTEWDYRLFNIVTHRRLGAKRTLGRVRSARTPRLFKREV